MPSTPSPPKVHLIRTCLERGIPIVSSMGSGGKTDPSRVRVDDISHTEQCALARTVRQRLRRLGIRRGLTVVYSTEPARREAVMEVDERYKEIHHRHRGVDARRLRLLPGGGMREENVGNEQ